MDALRIYKELVLMLVIGAHSQLVDIQPIEDGGTFTVTCDASRLAIPSAVTLIYYLSLERVADTATQTTLIATYSPGLSKNLTKSIPSGRNWKIEASGGRGLISDPDNNRKTIKLSLSVTDARCSDAGVYICNASFVPTSGIVTASRSQNITAKVKTEAPVMKSNNHMGNNPFNSENEAGLNMTLTCSVLGPPSIRIHWLWCPRNGFSCASYPVTNEVDDLPPTGKPCERIRHESSLNFFVAPYSLTYICVVKDGNLEMSRTNLTVGVRTINSTTETEFSMTQVCPEVGAVVGITAACSIIGTAVAVFIGQLLVRKFLQGEAIKELSKPNSVYCSPSAEYSHDYQSAYVTADGYDLPRTAQRSN